MDCFCQERLVRVVSNRYARTRHLTGYKLSADLNLTGWVCFRFLPLRNLNFQDAILVVGSNQVTLRITITRSWGRPKKICELTGPVYALFGSPNLDAINCILKACRKLDRKC